MREAGLEAAKVGCNPARLASQEAGAAGLLLTAMRAHDPRLPWLGLSSPSCHRPLPSVICHPNFVHDEVLAITVEHLCTRNLGAQPATQLLPQQATTSCTT